MHTERENKLFVGMLPKNVDEGLVEGLFAPFGKIKEIHIIRSVEVVVGRDGERAGKKGWRSCVISVPLGVGNASLTFISPPSVAVHRARAKDALF